MMETMKPVHSRGGWQEDEINILFQAVRSAGDTGQPLRDVFAEVAGELKRKPNSIRNFYYAKLRQLPDMCARKAPFRMFTKEEIHELLRTVLMARGNGESVRACVTRMAGGDRGLMLRYQNKYRSILKNRPDMLEAAAAELRAEGLPCPAQATGTRRQAQEAAGADGALEEAARLSQALKDDCLQQMVSGLCGLYQRLWQAESVRAETPAPGKAGPAIARIPSGDLEITLTDLRDRLEEAGEEESDKRWMDARREADRLRVQVDLLKLHLEDVEERHQGQLSLLRSTVHEFLSLPQSQRQKSLETFVNQAGEALRALDLEEERG